MSLYDYQLSKVLSAEDPPFAALIMAAIRKADTANVEKLRIAFPEIHDELRARYDAPGGVLAAERDER